MLSHRLNPMLQMRRAKKQYKHRNDQPAEETLRIFKQMLAGSEEGARWCLRARCGGTPDSACCAFWEQAVSPASPSTSCVKVASHRPFQPTRASGLHGTDNIRMLP